MSSPFENLCSNSSMSSDIINLANSVNSALGPNNFISKFCRFVYMAGCGITANEQGWRWWAMGFYYYAKSWVNKAFYYCLYLKIVKTLHYFQAFQVSGLVL